MADESLGAIDPDNTRLLIDKITVEQVRSLPEINLHNLGCERVGQFPARFPAYLYGFKICIDAPPGFSLHVRGGKIHTQPAQWFGLMGRHEPVSIMVDLFEALRELKLAAIENIGG
jgi:hypothetical protein